MAALSIFAGLAANLENRMGDLATLRALGYTKNRVFKIIIFEGMTIIILGLILGLLFGITIFEIINNVSGNRENLVKVNCNDCTVKKAERIETKTSVESLSKDITHSQNSVEEPDWELIKRMSELSEPVDGVPKAPDLEIVES